MVRNLGVLMDNKLAMTDHVNHITQVCYGLMRSLCKIFKWLPLTSRMPLVQGLIMSRLDYGNALLMSTTEDLLTRLQVLQNTAARLVLNLLPRTPPALNLAKLHWLPIRKRIQFKIGCLVHKTLTGQGPRYLANKLKKYVPTRSLRSTNKHLLVIPRIYTVKNGGRSFSHSAPTLWNTLPLSLRMETNLRKFRKSLKTWLF